MNKRHAGFTLVEMLIVIAIIGFVLAGTSDMFISMLRTHRQQSRIAETNIEGVIGLELFRQDLEKAGYGLPWNMNGFTYSETSGNVYSLDDATSNPPRGIVSRNDVSTGPALIGTDYLTIKAANVATNTVCSKWTFLQESGGPTSWSLNSGASATSENFNNTDRVIVISPGTPNTPSERTLISGSTPFSAVSDFQSLVNPETRIIYGIDNADSNPLNMPFNRADYFVMRPSSSAMPKRCAPETGILYKAVVNQNGGGMSYMPLLDCVADMQVVFRLDRNADGILDSNTNILTDTTTGLPLTASDTRNQVKEVRVYILAHEGQKDTNYTHPANAIYVGGDPTIGNSLAHNFDLTTITDWQNYRWKIYTLVVQLNNLK